MRFLGWLRSLLATALSILRALGFATTKSKPDPMPVKLNAQMLEEMLSGSLSMAFPSASLTQLAAKNADGPVVTHTGSASVALDEGRLILQFLTPSALSFQQVYKILDVEPGELIPKHMMFRFEGTQASGDKWICD